MNVSIYNQCRQLEKMIQIMRDFTDNLSWHVIKQPEEVLEEAFRYGLPEETGLHYRYKYLVSNKIDTELIITYINKICIPYLEDKLKKLKELLN